MVKNYSNRTRKHLYVVAYDVADDKRRSKIVKLLEQCGDRINRSVFECMLTLSQKHQLEDDIANIVNDKEDQIAIYHICVNCYSKTEYLPRQKKGGNTVMVS